MYDGGGYPASYTEAMRFLATGRAWVACLPCEGCDKAEGQHTHTMASHATDADLMSNPATWGYLHPACPPKDRVSFLLGGINVLAKEEMGVA